MLTKIFYFCSLIFTITSTSISAHILDKNVIEFNNFVIQHDKHYTDEESVLKFEIFKNNIEKIDKHNSENEDWKMSINKFADLTSDEFKEMYINGYKKPKYGLLRKQIKIDYSVDDLPSEIDWTLKGAVTEVKDQGQCGSCWAFSTTGSVEGAYFLSTGKLVSFSEQQLVDCAGSYGNQGCNGGLMEYGFKYIEDSGICAEQEYGYKAVDGKCAKCTTITKIESFIDVTPNNEKALQMAVSLQPISIAIEADQLMFQFYKSGVFTSTCGTKLDHGVLIVGYGTLNGVDYWKVKNSWGATWGDKGYILLQRNVKSPSGQCGLAIQPSYPVMSTTY